LAAYGMEEVAVEMKGIFHRNYSPDLMSKPTDKEKIELSRDSIYHQLPENLFFTDDDLKHSEIFKEKRKKRKLFFQPLDSEYFNLSLALEKEINSISEENIRNLIDSPNEDMEDSLLDNISLSEIRGNERLITDIVKIILDIQKIELIKMENPACPECIRKTFIIHIPKLTTKEYFQKNNQIAKLFGILKEYFLPFDIEYDFKIKDRQHKFILYENLILDYNTNI
jgi:hypothetical protein